MNKEIKRLIDMYEERIMVLQSGFLVNGNSELLALEAVIDDLKALQPSPLPESVEELVRDAAKVEMGVSYEPHMSQIDESFIEGAIFGAKYHQSYHSAEVERLREALQKIASHIQHGQLIRDAYADAKRIAKDALKEK